MPDWVMAAGDTLPALTRTLTDGNGNPVNLTGATVSFIMWQRGATTAKVSASTNITNPTTGAVSYAWSTGDTDTAGDFFARFKVTLANGKVETHPNDGYLSIQITPEVG